MIQLSDESVAHPNSHVDAWARIGTHLDIRVTLFLDNVLAWQDIHRRTGNSLVPADVARNALERFDETLQKLLTVYDANGRRLQSRLEERPRWKPSDTGVDLAADAGLRLTWSLRYPWREAQQSFSIQHSFVEHRSPPMSETSDTKTTRGIPTELRLRVRDNSSGHRIDAVVAYHQPHTIVLPLALTESNSQQNQTSTAASLVLRPRILTHEFTIPLVLATESVCPPELVSLNDSLHPKTDAAATRELAANWVHNHCEVSIDGRLAVAQSTFVVLLTAENEQIDDLETVPVVGTRLGIRTTHRIEAVPQNIAVSWSDAPHDVNQIQLNTIAGENNTSQVVDCRGANADFGQWNYTWNLPNGALSKGGDLALKPVDASRMTDAGSAGVSFKDQELWPGKLGSGIPGWTLWAVLVVTAVGMIAGIRWRFGKKVNAAMVALAVISGLSIALPRPTVEPDAEVAATLIDQMLNQAYRAVLVRDDQLAVEQLSKVLTDDMVETVFSQMIGDAENAPFVRISNVQVVSCTPGMFAANDYARFYCDWRIDGEILHWGHRHQRNRLLTGVIRLESIDGHCRISDISLEAAKTNSDSRGS